MSIGGIRIVNGDRQIITHYAAKNKRFATAFKSNKFYGTTKKVSFQLCLLFGQPSGGHHLHKRLLHKKKKLKCYSITVQTIKHAREAIAMEIITVIAV